MTRLALIVATTLLAIAPRPQAQQPASSALSLVGTWTLEATEQGGQRVPTPRGVLIVDGAGHIFETITRASRQQPANAQPRLTDQRYTFATYSGFWGHYRLDADKKTVTMQAEGAVHPNVMGRSFTRTIELQGDMLTLIAGADEPQVAAGTRWQWARVPNVDNLSPTYRRVIGFWQHVVERRVNLTTKATLSETKRAPSLIVYSPAGYVGVHFPPLNRQKFAADAPTEAEATAGVRGYVGYFGALGVYPNMVFHQVLAGISPAAGSTLKRPLEMNGNEVTINFPPTTNQQGEQQATQVVLRRLSGEDAMLK